MTFWGAAVFQWINVKGWVMVIGSITAYAAIAAFPWNIVIQTAHRPRGRSTGNRRLRLVWKRAAAGADLAHGSAHLQHRHGDFAARLPDSGSLEA